MSCPPRCSMRILTWLNMTQHRNRLLPRMLQGPMTWSEIMGMDLASGTWNFDLVHHLLTIQTEDHRFSRGVAEPSQDCCLSRVGSPDYEDTSNLCWHFLFILSSESSFRYKHCERRGGSCRCERFKVESKVSTSTATSPTGTLVTVALSLRP